MSIKPAETNQARGHDPGRPPGAGILNHPHPAGGESSNFDEGGRP